MGATNPNSIVGHLVGGELSATILPLGYLTAGDEVAISRTLHGVITPVHSAITDTVALATCSEVDCQGFGAVMVLFTLSTTNVTWTFAVYGATQSGLTFVPHLDTAGAAIVYTTDVSGWFVVIGNPDWIKVVPTKVDVGASTCTVKVQPRHT